MQYTYGNTIKVINNEKGIALVSALMLGVLGMLMVASLLVMVDTGTWLSGSKKRYQMVLDAAYGGMDFFTKELIPKRLGGTDLSAMGTYGGLLTPVISNTDFTKKLTTTGKIGDGTFPTDTIDTTITMAFPSAPNIAVDTHIISTSRGNSGTSSNLLQGGGVVNNNSGTVTPQHIPYLYQTETEGKNATNAIENANLSSIYMY